MAFSKQAMSFWRLRSNNVKFSKLHLPILSFSLLAFQASADEVNIAVAANFTGVMKQLEQRFEAETGHDLLVSYSSTVKLFSQIKHDAPFEILLAADVEHPQKLVDEGDAVAGSLFVYAVGQLVLWSPKADFIDQQGDVLKKGDFSHLAIANPKTAPYGAAAQQVLEKLNLWATLRDKVVQGDNITQTYQFVSTGNAELGFIALSQYIDSNKMGSYWSVPQDLYQSIEQGAVLLKKGENHDAAKAFITFLHSDATIEVIEKFGYAVPK